MERQSQCLERVRPSIGSPKLKLIEDLINDKKKVSDVANKAFARAKAQVAHLYLDLDFDNLDLFKIMKYGQLVDEEDEHNQEIIPLIKEENVNITP